MIINPQSSFFYLLLISYLSRSLLIQNNSTKFLIHFAPLIIYLLFFIINNSFNVFQLPQLLQTIVNTQFCLIKNRNYLLKNKLKTPFHRRGRLKWNWLMLKNKIYKKIYINLIMWRIIF